MPLPLDQLEAEAARMEREVAKLVAAGDLDRARRLAEEAVAVREFVEARRKTEGLQPREHSARVSTGPMVDDHRIAISAGRSKQERGKKDPDPFIATLNEAGYSLRSLAPELGIKPATLSAHRKAKNEPNSRPIPRDRAAKIKALTGWPDDARHWPCGFAD